MTKDVSILLPCRNEESHIDACLASIVGQKELTQESEILVIDGDSDDGTYERVAAWQAKDGRVRLLRNTKRYVSAALNLGISAATNDIIVRMDAHTEYADDYVSNCLQVLDETGADNVGGPARTKSKGYFQEAVRLAYHHPLVVGGSRFHNATYEGEVDTVTYGCWHRSTLIDIGGFDEDLIRNQDDELNFRIISSGGKVWQSPKIRSWYWPRSSVSALAKQYFQYGYWKVRVIQKHKKPASLRHIIPGFFAASLLLSALMSPFSIIARYALLGLASSYLAFVIVTSLSIALAQGNIRYLPVLPVAVMSFQLPYGFGFLLGLVDVLRRSSRRTSVSELSR